MIESLERLSLHPEISLSTADCIELPFRLSMEETAASVCVHRKEPPSTTNEHRTLVLVHRLLDDIEVQISRGGNRLGLTHVIKLDRLIREQLLEHVRVLELRAYGSPLCTINAFCLSDINRLVYETELVVRSLVLEVVSISLTELEDLLDDLRGRLRDLDRVSLNMSNRETVLLHEVLQVDHEQSATLSHDIVDVSRILERIVELRRSQTIDDVNDNLQSIGQLIGLFLICEMTRELPTEHLLGGLEVSMLNSNSSSLQSREVLSVLTKEV